MSMVSGVVGGVDTHADVHVAAAIDVNGALFGIEVVEVDRPNRQTRRRFGKSDPIDAEAAARAALSGTATVIPKRRDGTVGQIRVLMIARRSARVQRNQTLNQLRQVVFCGPDETSCRFKDRPKAGVVVEAAKMRPRKGSDPIEYTTNVVIRGLARTWPDFVTITAAVSTPSSSNSPRAGLE